MNFPVGNSLNCSRNVLIRKSIADKVYTVPKVVNEIKDRGTLQRLQVLPYQLIPKTPSPECIRIVTDFSKKTGDYRSLSAADIQIIALTYQLEKENVGTDHIKSTPNSTIEWTTSKALLEKPTEIAGFYLAKSSNSRTTSESTATSDLQESHVSEHQSEHTESHDTSQDLSTQNSQNVTNELLGMRDHQKPSDCQEGLGEDIRVEQNDNVDETEEGVIVSENMLEESEEDEGIEEDEEGDDDDDEGWITPNNIQSLKDKMNGVDQERAAVTVGCVTLDFAIQNVLIQMGLNVISVDGMLIKRAKNFVQRCFACMKITKDMTKVFCPYCGNNTLQKVSMTINDDGSVRYFMSRRKQISTRGMRYTLPAPKGGKHSNNPVLVADQPMPQQRAAKKLLQKDVFDPDYVAGQSPFALNDITSRSAQLGIRNNQFNKRNPNSSRHGKRK